MMDPQNNPPHQAPDLGGNGGWVLFWTLHGLTWLCSLFVVPGNSLAILFLIPLASMYGGVWLAVRYFKVTMARVGLSLLFIILLFFVNLAICFAGCLVGSQLH